MCVFLCFCLYACLCVGVYFCMYTCACFCVCRPATSASTVRKWWSWLTASPSCCCFLRLTAFAPPLASPTSTPHCLGSSTSLCRCLKWVSRTCTHSDKHRDVRPWLRPSSLLLLLQFISTPTKRSSLVCTVGCPPSLTWMPSLPSRHCGKPSLTMRWPQPSRSTSS